MAFAERGRADPHGGLARSSVWLSEDHLIRLLASAGYRDVHVLGRDLMFGHPHITIIASA